MERLTRYDCINARVVKARLLTGTLLPANARMRIGCGAHLRIRFDRDYANTAIGKEPRRDAGPGTDVGDGEFVRIAEAVKRCVNRPAGIGGAVRGVVAGTGTETSRRVYDTISDRFTGVLAAVLADAERLTLERGPAIHRRARRCTEVREE